MDLGVGTCIFSMGLVAPLSKRVPQSSAPGLVSVGRSARSMAFTLGLGSARLIALKSISYQEHVSEYGVHWNFFFTLAAIEAFQFCAVNLVVAASRRYPGCASDSTLRWCSALTAMVISGCYEVMLSGMGLAEYIFTAPRADFFSSNREGICSALGFVSIWLWATVCGRLIHSASDPKALLRALVAVAAGMGCGVASSRQDCSRRLCNLPYVMLVVCFSASVLSLLLAQDIVSRRSRPNRPASLLLEAINRHQLAVFLLANALTGLVNVTTDTLAASNTWSILVLVCYASTFSAAAVFVFSGPIA